MVRIGHGRSDFSAGPTRTDGRPRRRHPDPIAIPDGGRPGTLAPRPASQARHGPVASGSPGFADLVTGDAFLSQSTFQARRPTGSDAGKWASGAGGYELARDRRRSNRRTAGHSGAAGGRGQEIRSRFRCATPAPSCATSACSAMVGERPSPALPLVVAESEPVAVDRDEVFLIEDWRLRPDGTAIAPGIDPKDAPPLYTINGLATLDIAARRQRAAATPVYQWLPTQCYCYQNRRPRGPRHGHRRPACRALPRARRRDRAGAG